MRGWISEGLYFFWRVGDGGGKEVGRVCGVSGDEDGEGWRWRLGKEDG